MDKISPEYTLFLHIILFDYVSKKSVIFKKNCTYLQVFLDLPVVYCVWFHFIFCYFNIFFTGWDELLFKFYLFLDRGEGKEIERERNINVWLLLTYPLLATWPTTQACALTGNRTSNTLVCRLALNPLSHTRQGRTLY